MNRLTPREQEIALLVHAGLSNKAIADRLCLTVPTVKRHLQNTFRKLSISNRTLLAILVQQSRKLGLALGRKDKRSSTGPLRHLKFFTRERNDRSAREH